MSMLSGARHGRGDGSLVMKNIVPSGVMAYLKTCCNGICDDGYLLVISLVARTWPRQG